MLRAREAGAWQCAWALWEQWQAGLVGKGVKGDGADGADGAEGAEATAEGRQVCVGTENSMANHGGEESIFLTWEPIAGVVPAGEHNAESEAGGEGGGAIPVDARAGGTRGRVGVHRRALRATGGGGPRGGVGVRPGQVRTPVYYCLLTVYYCLLTVYYCLFIVH